MQNRMKQLRERMGLTRAEIARRTGMSPSTVGQIEAERTKAYPSQASRIAAILGIRDPGTLLDPVSAEELAEESAKKPTPKSHADAASA